MKNYTRMKVTVRCRMKGCVWTHRVEYDNDYQAGRAASTHVEHTGHDVTVMVQYEKDYSTNPMKALLGIGDET